MLPSSIIGSNTKSMAALSYVAIELSVIEKPPVASPVIPWLMAPQIGIPASHRARIATSVNRMKIHQIVRTVETMLGWIFSERASLS